MSTTWQQLEGAALALARSGPIKERLTDAYRNHLALVSANELPETLRGEFNACQDALTRERPLRGEDAVRATVRKMSNVEADEVACSVLRLFVAFVRESAGAAGAGIEATAVISEMAVNGVALNGVGLNGGAPVNGVTLNGSAAAAARKVLKAVPQVISLCAGEA